MARHRSFSAHYSFHTSPQHAHYISPLLSFQNMPKDYIPTLPDFEIHNTSSAHVHQEHYFQDPSTAYVASHQLLPYDSTYSTSEIALALGEQFS